MITALVLLALGAEGGWTEVKANGFVFQMPAKPVEKNGPVTWPTTGKMIQTEWTSKVSTGDVQVDVVACYESTVPSPRMLGLMHDQLCREDGSGKPRWDRVDPTTQAKECLRMVAAPDGKRRILNKIYQVGDNVCVFTSSAKIAKDTDDVSPQMRRFVDSLKATGKQTVLSTTPWVQLKGDGFAFEMPTQTDPISKEETEPGFGKYRTTTWKAQMADEEVSVACMPGGTKPMKALLAACEQPDPKVVKTKLPNGATECAAPGGPKVILMRSFPMGTNTCVISATRTSGDLSTNARRFVESFAKAK